MTVVAFGVIPNPKPRPPPTVASVELIRTYDQACIELLYACFCELPRHEISARANRMREVRMQLERR